MNVVIQLLVCFLCFQLSFSDEATYRAGTVENFHPHGSADHYANVIKKAAENNVDILMLPSSHSSDKTTSDYARPTNYDEMIKTLSQAAKEADIYVVAQLIDRVRCNNDYELYENGLVFDRTGHMVSIFRSPIGGVSKCNSTTEETVVLKTDFGVKFSHVSSRDIVLKNPQSLAKGVKNFIAFGSWHSELPFLTSAQYLSTWSNTIGANLLIDFGIYSGKEVQSLPVDSSARLLVATLDKMPRTGNSATTSVQATQPKINNHEDLSQYTIRYLNLDDSSSGLKETVCHDQFCCQFYVKTSGSQRGDVSSYALAVFHGVRPFGASHNIGVQSCAVVACAGAYERSCVFGSSNDTSGLTFDKIVINGNFSSENAIQYPTALTSSVTPLSNEDCTFDSSTVNDVTQVTFNLQKSSDLLTFGIFGREFSKDVQAVSVENLTNDNNIYDYIFNDEMSEFVDYLWIRLRVLLFVVSIYVLEMM